MVSFQRTKREDFYTHYFIGVLAYVVISRHFILKLIIWRLSSWETIISPNFIDWCIKSFLNKLYTPKVMVQNAPKRNIFVKLLFLGSTSFQIRKKLQKLFSDKLTSCSLKIVFTSPVTVKSFFTFKDKLPKVLLSGLVWWLQCYLLRKDQTPFSSPNLWTFRHFTCHWKKGKDWQE